MIYDILETDWGPFLFAEETGCLQILDHLNGPVPHPILPHWRRDSSALALAKALLSSYLNGENPAIEIPLCPQGTPFQKTVWHQLTAIPYGKTLSYQDIAVSIGKPNAVRAVGQAIGRNPIQILIPCHRVIGKNNSLTGYAGGLAMKQRLLELERSWEAPSHSTYT